MPIEVATWISELVATNPPGGDKVSEGDDHIRKIKQVLQSTFPDASKAFRFPKAISATTNVNPAVTNQNTAYTVNASGGSRTVTLPNGLATANEGWSISVTKVDSTTNPVIIAPASGSINGSPDVRLTSQYEWAIVTWTGSTFIAMAGMSPSQIESLKPAAFRTRLATVGNVNIATALLPGASIDGLTVNSGNIVLVPEQTNEAQNGIYVSATPPVRHPLFSSYAAHASLIVAVEAGDTKGDTLWYCTSNQAGTLGTDDLLFIPLFDLFKEPGQDFINNLDAVKGQTPGFLHGCQLVWSSANLVQVGAGTARDLSDSDSMVLAAAMTKNLNVVWAAGNNNGGRDSASVSNGTWHVFVIKNPTSGAVDVLFSTSTNPVATMPSGYTLKRRVGSILRVAGNIKEFFQHGNHFYWNAAEMDVNVVDPDGAAVAKALTVPQDVVVEADIWAGVRAVAGAMNIHVFPMGISIPALQDPLDNIVVAPISASTYRVEGATAASSLWEGTRMRVVTDTNGNVRVRVLETNSNIQNRYAIVTYGYLDRRDRQT